MTPNSLLRCLARTVSWRNRGRDSQTDVFAIMREGRTIAVAVEGEVTKSFGPTIKGWYVEPIAGKEKQLSILVQASRPRLHLHLKCPTSYSIVLCFRSTKAIQNSTQAAMVVTLFSAPNKWFDVTQVSSGYLGWKQASASWSPRDYVRASCCISAG